MHINLPLESLYLLKKPNRNSLGSFKDLSIYRERQRKATLFYTMLWWEKYIGRTRHNPSSEPSADWWVLPTANWAGIIVPYQRAKHGGALKEEIINYGHPLDDRPLRTLLFRTLGLIFLLNLLNFVNKCSPRSSPYSITAQIRFINLYSNTVGIYEENRIRDKW
jgi:hypothetical protein